MRDVVRNKERSKMRRIRLPKILVLTCISGGGNLGLLGLRELFSGGFQARFPPAVAPQAALKFSYRSDRVTRD